MVNDYDVYIEMIVNTKGERSTGGTLRKRKCLAPTSLNSKNSGVYEKDMQICGN